MTNRLKTKFFIFLVLLFVFIFPFLIVSAAPNLEYAPMETLPGFAKTADFAVFISNLYKFGIWTVGICALIMIVIGGYMYAASGGNNASMEKAKGFITDALVGLVLALLAYLILYIIDPELVKIKMGGPAPVVTLPPPANCTGGPPWANSILCSNIIPATSTSISLMNGACPSTETPCTYRCADGFKTENLKCISITTVSTGGTTCTGSGGSCSQVDSAINSNSSGIDAKVLKTIIAGGEGCNKSLSSDGYGSCGYSQALPTIRTACGISGTASETCAKIQNDVQLDVNCAAWLVNNQSGRCTTTDYVKAGCCYNGGPSNSDCHKSAATNYQNKLTNYYEKYCK